MRFYQFNDTGVATASAILSFTIVRPSVLKRVTWSCSIVENAGSNGLLWQISTSPVATLGVQGNENILSQVIVHVDWRSAVGMTQTGTNFIDEVDYRLLPGQILYFHRSAVTAAPGSASMTALLRMV